MDALDVALLAMVGVQLGALAYLAWASWRTVTEVRDLRRHLDEVEHRRTGCEANWWRNGFMDTHGGQG